MDEQVSGLRKALEGMQSVGHSPDIVDRSAVSAFEVPLFGSVAC